MARNNSGSINSHTEAELHELEQKLGVRFKNRELLRQSITHKSYTRDNPLSKHYERLEFFGDAILKFVVTEFLFSSYPQWKEGQLTETRSVLVDSSILQRVGSIIGIAKYIRVGRGVAMQNSMVARSMEAILGAIYLDQGLDVARLLIDKYFCSCAENLALERVKENYKAHLQHLTQAEGMGLPVYELKAIDGPDHAPQFQVEVLVAGKSMGSGWGTSKKNAEQEAAKVACSKFPAAPEK